MSKCKPDEEVQEKDIVSKIENIAEDLMAAVTELRQAQRLKEVKGE